MSDALPASNCATTKKGVEVTAQLSADAKDLIRSDTQFWVVKPRIDQSGVTGLGTLLSGSYIAFTPGKSQETKDIFVVQDIPPIAAIGQSGLRLNLVGKKRPHPQRQQPCFV